MKFSTNESGADSSYLVDMLVDAAPLPEDQRAAHLAGVLLLVDHGPPVLGGVVLHGHVVSLLLTENKCQFLINLMHTKFY